MMLLRIRYLACLGAFIATPVVPAAICNAPLHAAAKSTATSRKPKIDSKAALTKLLFSAVQRRDLKTVRSLVARGADVNGRTALEETPLMLAMPALNQKANVNQQDREGRNALMTVILRGRISRAPYLGPPSEYPAFQVAKSIATTAVMKEEAQQAAAKFRRETAAERAAADIQDIAVIKSLLAAGANQDSKDKQGRTALQMAHDSHRAGIITLLENCLKK